MKRIVFIWLWLMLSVCCLMLAGCGDTEDPAADAQRTSAVEAAAGKENAQSTTETDAQPASEAGTATPEDNAQSPADTAAAPEAQPDTANQQGDAGEVDVDLTALSATMVYAEVYNMMTAPEAYMGKTVKMRGQYYASYYEVTDNYYHYVIIADATACCQQGIEFIWNGDHQYPQDYPDDNTQIEVTGIFGSYEELGYTFYYLSTDAITVVD